MTKPENGRIISAELFDLEVVMGSWGTGIFSDDLALDIKEDYNTILRYIEDDKEILEIMKERYADCFQCDDEISVFWYALAYSQWQKGRLDEETKEKALYYIDNPEKDGNLTLWKEEKRLYDKRLTVLTELKKKLNSLQSERKRYKCRQGVGAAFEIGDIVKYPLSEKEYKKFVKAHKGDLSEEDIQDLHSVFDGINIYMIKLYDEEYALENLFGIEEARRRKLTAHHEYFAIFKNFQKRTLTKEELYDADIRFDHFVKFGSGEIVKQDCYLSRLSAFDYIYDKRGHGDAYFTDLKKFERVGNDRKLAEKLLVENDIDIEKQIDSEYGLRSPIPRLNLGEYYISEVPIAFSIEFILSGE